MPEIWEAVFQSLTLGIVLLDPGPGTQLSRLEGTDGSAALGSARGFQPDTPITLSALTDGQSMPCSRKWETRGYFIKTNIFKVQERTTSNSTSPPWSHHTHGLFQPQEENKICSIWFCSHNREPELGIKTASCILQDCFLTRIPIISANS